MEASGNMGVFPVYFYDKCRGLDREIYETYR